MPARVRGLALLLCANLIASLSRREDGRHGRARQVDHRGARRAQLATENLALLDRARLAEDRLAARRTWTTPENRLHTVENPLLLANRKRVNLALFKNRGRFGQEWFQLELNPGNRDDTFGFEDRFRQNAQKHLESWYEVVYWKMYSQGRRDH